MAVNEKAIARAEIIIEGELLPGVRVEEDQHTHTGHAMPEFPGYCGKLTLLTGNQSEGRHDASSGDPANHW